MDVTTKVSGWLFVTLAMIGLLGCEPTEQSQVPAGDSVTTTAAADLEPVESKEYWEAHYIGDDRVGYSHTATKTFGKGDDQYVETTNVTQLKLKRFGETVSQTIEVVSISKPDGTPIRFESSMKSGPQVMTTGKGEWKGNQLRVQATTQGKTASQNVEWKPEYGGPFASLQSLERDPLEPGEDRTVFEFMPTLNVIGEVQLTAKDYETTKVLEGEESLLRVEMISSLLIPGGKQKIESTVWVNREGQAMKSYLPQLKQTTYRTTKARATKESTGSFDLADATIVKLSAPIEMPHAASAITYKATLPEGDIKGVFVGGPTQKIEIEDEHTCTLTVTAIRPDAPAELEQPDEKPTKDDIAPNTLIQSDDKLIVGMAIGVAQDEEDAWKVAQALEGFVHRTIDKKDFSQAFATAAEVAKDRTGDCTEHAVLLAALCRARRIPARTAIGLVYYPQAEGFAYHMWTEVWITDRWIPLDATLGRGGIGAGHLKLAQSNLKGADAYSAFLPVFKVLGQLKLEVVE